MYGEQHIVFFLILKNWSINMNIDPHIWGKHYWFVLHTITFTYPENPNDTAKRKYYDLIVNLPLFLPNAKIGREFSTILDEYPVKPYLDSRGMLVKWLHFVHNVINKRTGKEEMSYETFLHVMQKKLSVPLEKPTSIYDEKTILFFGVVFVFCCIILLDRRFQKV